MLKRFNFIKAAADDALSAKIMMDSIRQFLEMGGVFIRCIEQTDRGPIPHRPVNTLRKQADFEEFHLQRTQSAVNKERYGLLWMKYYQEAKAAYTVQA